MSPITAAGSDHVRRPNVFRWGFGMSQTITISTELALNSAIAQIDNGLNFDGSAAATGTAYTINLGIGFTLGSDIMALALVKSATLTIDGQTNTINGGYTGSAGSGYRGFLVYQGDVTIQNVTITDAVARGGAGGSFFAAAAGAVDPAPLLGIPLCNGVAHQQTRAEILAAGGKLPPTRHYYLLSDFAASRR
jgi:hypothetical protein